MSSARSWKSCALVPLVAGVLDLLVDLVGALVGAADRLAPAERSAPRRSLILWSISFTSGEFGLFARHSFSSARSARALRHFSLEVFGSVFAVLALLLHVLDRLLEIVLGHVLLIVLEVVTAGFDYVAGVVTRVGRHPLCGRQRDLTQPVDVRLRLLRPKVDVKRGVVLGHLADQFAAHRPGDGLADGLLMHAELGCFDVIDVHVEHLALIADVAGDVGEFRNALHHGFDLVGGRGQSVSVRAFDVDDDVPGLAVADAHLDASDPSELCQIGPQPLGSPNRFCPRLELHIERGLVGAVLDLLEHRPAGGDLGRVRPQIGLPTHDLLDATSRRRRLVEACAGRHCLGHLQAGRATSANEVGLEERCHEGGAGKDQDRQHEGDGPVREGPIQDRQVGVLQPAIRLVMGVRRDVARSCPSLHDVGSEDRHHGERHDQRREQRDDNGQGERAEE